jgi:hypothetical protein
MTKSTTSPFRTNLQPSFFFLIIILFIYYELQLGKGEDDNNKLCLIVDRLSEV